LFLECVRQTGGLGSVVSLHAVGNANSHGLISRFTRGRARP
jgi:hypothetical protein